MLAEQELRQNLVEPFRFFDLWFMGGILEAVDFGTWNDLLKLLVPVFLIQRIVFARHDEQWDRELG